MQPRGARHQRQEHQRHAQQRVSTGHALPMAIAIPSTLFEKARFQNVCAHDL
jgi:hypothetical protein